MQTEAVADSLKDAVKRSKYVDVGKGVEVQMGISKEKLKAGLNALVESGDYESIASELPRLQTKITPLRSKY